MSYSKQTYNQAMDIINERRTVAERNAEKRQLEIYSKYPEIEKINREISSSGVKAAKAVLMGNDIKEEMSKLKVRNLQLQEELKSMLISNGYPQNALEPWYTCKTCNDTGYYESNNKTLVCDCLKKALIKCNCDQLNSSSPLSLCTFDTFSLDKYSMDINDKGTSHYNTMSKILNYSLDYANTFNENSKSLFMRGATGLGKTHLSLAIANAVINKGYSVIYVSAPNILSKLEKAHFSNGAEEQEILDSLMQCDLLIIDDLGTEFSNNFSVAEIYNIFNSRLLLNKPVIISTNLTLSEIESTYTMRLLSRLVGCTVRLEFAGNDVRIADRSKKNQ